LLWLSVLALIGLVVLPCLNAFAPKESALHVSSFAMSLYGKYLCYAVVALGVGILWGYTGLLSLGQCLFFALGGYAMGMHLILMIGERGVYKSRLPDYMVFLEFDKRFPETGGLPPWFTPFQNFSFAVSAVIWVPALVALVFGFLAFRARIKGVYFSILTQALTYAACLMFFRNDFTFGGNNGFTDFKDVLGHDLNAPATKRALYIASGLLLLATYLQCRWITSTRFGKIQRAIRDSENRVLFSGYATANFKLFIFVFAAVISGIAGALYVPQVGIINPSEMSPDKSLEAVVWVAVGGRNSLVGPIFGALGVNWLKSYTTHSWPEYWLFILGGLFVFVTLLMPKGIVGLPEQFRVWKQRWRVGSSPLGVAKEGAMGTEHRVSPHPAPLPEGEGQGEGERARHTPDGRATVISEKSNHVEAAGESHVPNRRVATEDVP
jgi:urea transport system permease protein